MSLKSERTKHNSRGKRSSDESESSYGSSRSSSRAPSEGSYLYDRESKVDKSSKQGTKQNLKSQRAKKSKPLIRGQKEIFKNGRGDENVTTKLLSENKIKISEMRNKNIELADLISKYEAENRDLMRIIRKQEKMLKHFQEQENSMPALMQRQSAESHALHEQLRNLKKKLKAQEEKLKAAEEELEQKQRLLKKMKGLVDDHQLKERDELRQKLNEVESELNGKSDIIKNLERHIDNLKKNHKHELGLKKAKQQNTAEELDAVRSELERMQTQLQEKEKELAVLNIYAQQRFQAKPPHRLPSSIRSTPMFDKNENYNSRKKARNNSLNDSKIIEMTPQVKPVETKTNMNLNYSNAKKLTAPRKNQVNENKSLKDQEDIDKKIEEMEKKAKIKVKQDKQIKMSYEESDKSETDLFKNKTESKTNQKQKEILLARMKEIDESHSSKSKSLKQPLFTDELDESPFGSYQPTFGNSSKPGHNKSKKKAEVISGLFNDDLENFKEELIYEKGRSKSPVLLNLSNDSGKKSQFHSSNKSNLLPLRMKQQVSSLATLNGIDSDEEIKELRLK